MYLAPEKGDNLWRKMKSNWRFYYGELSNKSIFCDYLEIWIMNQKIYFSLEILVHMSIK